MVEKIVAALRNPKKLFTSLRFQALVAYVHAHNKITSLSRNTDVRRTGLKSLDEIIERSGISSPITGHLTTLFVESLEAKPKLIVELGVDVGHSTFVFERVAKLTGSKLVGVDTENCSKASDWNKWLFVQKDDISFAKEFRKWCLKKGIKPVIDVLFIDTSHEYEHTVKEIKAWFPFLSENAKVFFHDTNLREVYSNKDGSKGLAWDNKRGVIRALEKYFRTSFDETREFVDCRNGWIIKHHPYSNGLTVLKRIKGLKKQV
jgi:cephalosporin hydroxylase